jgi:hypothetical protein
VTEFVRKNHGRCYDRPGERTASRFVNSGYMHHSGRSEFLFVAKSAAPIHSRFNDLTI